MRRKVRVRVARARRAGRTGSAQPGKLGSRRPEPAFGGASLLEVMLQEGLPGIARVRAHLLAQITR